MMILQWCYNNIASRWWELTSDDENYVRFLQSNNNNIVIGNDFDEEVTERCYDNVIGFDDDGNDVLIIIFFIFLHA